MKTLLRYRSAVGLILVLCTVGCSTSHNLNSNGAVHSVVADVQEFTCDGIPVLLRTSTAAPVVSAILFIKGGSTALRADQPVSLEYFTLNVAAASGNQNIGKSWFRRKMVRMGTGISGDDGRDFSAITMRCTRENFDTSWAYFTGIALHPAFDSVEFYNFRKSVLLGLESSSSDPTAYSNVVADSIYFYGHPYGRMLDAADARRPTLQAIAAHFKEIMVKKRLLLSVVGNITREELEAKIHETLADLPEGTYIPLTFGPPAKALSPGAYFPPFDRKLPTDYMTGYFLIPSSGDSDYYAYVRLRNFFGGFLFNHIRVEHNLAYAPNLDDREGRTSIGVITLQTPYVDSAVRIINQDIDFFRDNLIREDAIRSGVGRWTTSKFLQAETTQSQAALLGRAELYTGDWRNAFVSYSRLASVTPTQLNRAAVRYLRNINWVIVGDTTGIDKQLLLAR